MWKLYVNGVLENQDLSGTKFILQDGTSKIVFGKKGESFGDWYKGKMDEVRIYNRVLNQQEISILSQQTGACMTNCSNWLKTPSYPASISVGDLDVIGNKVTVEALYSSSSAITPTIQFGKLVSKHTGPGDVNYSLMPFTCEITTTNGYINTPPACMPVLDKLYHVAMVYDGAILKFYRNGFLLSSVPWTGNLVNNDLLTTIASGPNNPGPAYQQQGYLNEVRIWNVARNQTELRNYMNTSLPNPTTQTGLLGYYTFDNLLNKQGNAAYNGTLNGAATINNTTPNCSYVADSCGVMPTTQGCQGVIDLHGNNCVKLPLSQAYYANTGFTWETWFNSNWYENNDNTLRLGQSLIISEDATLCEDIQLGFGWQNIPRNAVGFVVDGTGQCNARDNNPVFYRPPGGFIPNTWYHVAGVRNYTTNQTQLYFNGQLVDTKTNTRQAFNRNILTRLGTYVVSGDSGFVGKMDEIRIWNKPRTAAEILANYNKCLVGNEANLVAYYRANENSGIILNNAVNNPILNGTLDPTVVRNNTFKCTTCK
ncbi:MAG: hypothetical protein IPP48_11370 [Chitinophagaceae bacterium]|nr:hypothetical protein [Chitinophagaceae bacterium]